MQVSKIAPEILMASAATQSPPIPGLALKKYLAALKSNNVTMFLAERCARVS